MPVALQRLLSFLPRLSSSTLLQRFAAASFLVILILGFVLAVILGQTVQSVALNEARQSAYDDLHARLLHQVSPADLTQSRMTGKRYRAFDSFIRGSILSDRTIRVKVWNSQGLVIYSDDGRIVGHRFPIEGELSEALHGALVSEVSTLARSENRDDRQYGKLLEVYIPIRFHRDGTTYGAFEIYQTYAPVARQISSLQHTGYAVLGSGLVVLYLLLFGIVRQGSNTITEQQHRLLRQAFHDALTGLPNRTLLQDRVQQAILAASRTGSPVALLLMDLNHFKEINDTFGHHYGDLLLQQLGSRLESVLRQSDTVARLGGDEFALLLPATDEQGAIMVAEKIRDALGQPFDVQSHCLTVGASLGITLYPSHGSDASTLLQRADVAMYYAKRTDSGYAVYAAEHDEYSPDRLSLINELRQAIEQGQLLLYYQPKVSLHTKAIQGVEALVRWHHPQRGLIPPDQFIPLAEHTGLIKPLTTWVLNRALQQCHDWQAAGLDLSIAVNLSARSLHDPHLVTTVAQVLDRWEITPDHLTIELTESALMVVPRHGAEILERLHTMGIRLAVDDFGTGYSSLAYLKSLPVDEIKIDKSFVRDMTAQEGDIFIVRSVADLGHSLGLEVVAEGVEDQQSFHLLERLGCDLAQGYLLSRPLPPADLQAWLLETATRAI